MDTNSIIESLNMAAVSRNGIPNALLHDIADALRERDALRAQLETAVSHLINVLYDSTDTTPAIINAERWLGQMAANEA